MAVDTGLGRSETMTLEAFADTILPGSKRSVDDRAVAGVADEPGAVAAGALQLLSLEATGFAPLLPGFAALLEGHARAYATDRDLKLDEDVPSFVALGFEDRTRLVEQLTAPGHPEREGWVGLALFSYMAFDAAPHLSTAEALAAGHPGLSTLGFAPPDPDGQWRFGSYSYGRQLAEVHPATTSNGSIL